MRIVTGCTRKRGRHDRMTIWLTTVIRTRRPFFKLIHILLLLLLLLLLLTNLLYHDYRCTCLISLLAGPLQDLRLINTGLLLKKWPIIENIDRQILTPSLELCFFRFWPKDRHLFLNRQQWIFWKSGLVK